MTTNNELLQLSHLDTMLARSTRIDEITSIRAKLEALRVYAVNIGKSKDECKTIAMARVRSERKVGKVLLGFDMNGNNQHSRGLKVSTPSLDDYGIDKSQSHRWQTIAKLPDDVFDRLMLGCIQNKKQNVTTGFFYNAGRIHTMRKAGISTDKPPPTPWHTPESLATLIKANMNTHQIEALIQLLTAGKGA